MRAVVTATVVVGLALVIVAWDSRALTDRPINQGSPISFDRVTEILPPASRGEIAEPVTAPEPAIRFDIPDPRIDATRVHDRQLAVAEESMWVTMATYPTPRRPRRQVLTYEVEEGDNVSTIAERYGLDTDSVVWANDKLEADPDYIVIGQKLVIPPALGVLHVVKAGDTVEELAKKYKVSAEAVYNFTPFNQFGPNGEITPGQYLMFPGGEKPYQLRYVYTDKGMIAVNAPTGSGRFRWPTDGWITTKYYPGSHNGIDIAGSEGQPIYAADAGVVIYAGEYGTYGNTIIIDHGGGFTTLYAHLLAWYPKVGMPVRKGQSIGMMGSTGKSTGNHLHFEIRVWGGTVNPLRYLPE